MNLKAVLLGLLVIVLILFGVYGVELHRLALQANRIFALRCTDVNPTLITYKNDFLSFSDAIKNPDNYPDTNYHDFYTSYIENMRKYVPDEVQWLSLNQQFIDSRAYKLFMPGYMKKTVELEQQMYMGYRDTAQSLLDIYDNGSGTAELNAKLSDATTRKATAISDYVTFVTGENKVSDLRKFFTSVGSPAGCTPENTAVPDTSSTNEEKPVPVGS